VREGFFQEMAEAILERIPAEKRWELAAQYECSCPDWGGAALKAVNPKLTVTGTKTQSRGDP